MVPIHTHQELHRLPLRNGYIVDGRIAWWKVQTRRQAIVMTVAGELDASNVDQFDSSVRQLSSSGEPFIIDLSDVNFVNSQCIRIFFALQEECQSKGRSWALVVPPPLRPVLRICDPTDVLPVVSSVPEALCDVAVADGGVVRMLPKVTRRGN